MRSVPDSDGAGSDRRRARVVILGAGFAGLYAAQELARAPVDLVVVDRSNHHLFQPLLYQVATAALSPADIASPIRKILRSQKNTVVALARAERVDVERRIVALEDGEIAYDYLIVATGATHSYFGNDAWAGLAPGLKTIDDATEIRRRFLAAFETAELEEDDEARRAALTFVVVGGGPTGVELAGAISEIAHTVIPRDFRFIDTTTARVVLVEGGERVLGAYSERLSASAKRQLEQLGVEVRLGQLVTHIDERGVVAGGERIDAASVFWAAGVRASPLGASLGAALDRSGRVVVRGDLTIEGHPEVFVVGDLASAKDPVTGEPAPGVAPAAIQMGKYAARIIRDEVRAPGRGGRRLERKPFRYVDRGSLATIGRSKAVGVVRGIEISGQVAWLAWAGIHVLFLILFRNRVAVMLSWIWTYFFFDRGARLITGEVDLPVKRQRRAPPAGGPAGDSGESPRRRAGSPVR